MRSPEKKKAWLKACREQVKAGFINKADGTWGQANHVGSGTEKNMVRDMQNGYHLNRR
jgi:hypothetical protein